MSEALMSWLLRLDPESAHRAGLAAAKAAQHTVQPFIRNRYFFEDRSLAQRVLGLMFVNPIGLAAGFDKNASSIPFWEALGFGFAEIGSVTRFPSRGQKRPRAFRLMEDRAIINRMGLPNLGAAQISKRIDRARRQTTIPIGVSLAKGPNQASTMEQAADQMRESFKRLAPLAGYVTLNLSCPNTTDGTDFEKPRNLDQLLKAVFEERRAQLRIPIFLKISPPVSTPFVYDSYFEEILAVGRSHGVDGYVVCNTATDRLNLKTSPERLEAIGPGGLSGPPLRSRALFLVRYLYQRLGPSVPIIGVGGIDSAESAYAFIRAGASLVQLYTGLVYEGPGLIQRIKEGLVHCCTADGLTSIRQAIGADVS